jgi:uncharacterized protein YkwD
MCAIVIICDFPLKFSQNTSSFSRPATMRAASGRETAQMIAEYVVRSMKGFAMFKSRLTYTLPLCALLMMPAMAQARSCDLPANMDELQAQLIDGVNAERAANGLPPLRLNAALDKAAQAHACDNAKRHETSHVSSDGSQLQNRLRRAGYRFAMANENTGRGFGSSQSAVDWWMNSPHHRDNILMRGTQDIGVGIAFSDAPESRLHWVIDMGVSH